MKHDTKIFAKNFSHEKIKHNTKISAKDFNHSQKYKFQIFNDNDKNNDMIT